MIGLVAFVETTYATGGAAAIVVSNLMSVLRFEIWAFLAVLTLLVFYQLLTGRINTDGLLYETKPNGSREYSATQLQALIVTVGGALYYLFIVLANKEAGKFPDIPDFLLVVLGGSNLVYLGERLLTLLVQKIKSA